MRRYFAVRRCADAHYRYKNVVKYVNLNKRTAETSTASYSHPWILGTR